MVVNPGKRKSGVKTMANTRQKLVDSLQVHRDASNSVRAQAMMAMVWQHMEENTEEVASIWEACEAGTFKVHSGPSEFAADHRYMLKVPKTFILAWLHSTIDEKFTNHFFKELCKADRLIVQKVFLMAVRSDGTMPIPSHNKEIFSAWCCARYEEFGANLDMKMFPKAGSKDSVDWNAHGFYQLQPPFNDSEGKNEEVKAEHKFTHIKVHNMMITIPDSVNITAAWSTDQNWSLKQAALVTPANAQPKLKLPIRTLCEPSEQFEVFYKKVCLHSVEGLDLGTNHAKHRAIVEASELAHSGGMGDAASVGAAESGSAGSTAGKQGVHGEGGEQQAGDFQATPIKMRRAFNPTSIKAKIKILKGTRVHVHVG